ncbi:hypothetical protein BZZ01_06785 [Nostocales cyanobacterium HT-58-2]|nr:hypothetical protein BZZ01_06785 [Nostocales cyanobacterium HT-58-2]
MGLSVANIFLFGISQKSRSYQLTRRGCANGYATRWHEVPAIGDGPYVAKPFLSEKASPLQSNGATALHAVGQQDLHSDRVWVGEG